MKKILPLIIFLSACAVVVHPTGGDKDETPPKAIRTYPDSQQTHYSQQEIRIYFDEYFEIKDPNAVLISPPPVKAPKIEVIGKYLRIQFKEPLYDSTTYTLQLINALQDINEKNILPDYKLSFSTGPHIDTAYIHGFVYDNYTGQALDGYTVALFHSNISDFPDSLVFPLYLSKSSTDGSFTIPSIRNTNYTLYAFNDINHNKRIDMGEDMGFIPKPVHPFDTLEIRVAKNALDPPLVTYSPVIQDIKSFFLPFKAPEKGTVKILSSQKSYDKSQTTFSRKIHQDTLLFVDFIKSDIDTQLLYFISLNDIITDTIQVNYPHQKPAYLLKLENSHSLIPEQSIHIHSNQVIRDVRQERFHLFIRDTIPVTGFQLSSTPFTLSIEYPFEERKSYTLILDKGAIHYYDDYFSETDTFQFHIKDKNNFGDVSILFANTREKNYEIHILKEIKEKPIFQINSSADSVYIKNLAAGEYFVRLVLLDSLLRPDQVVPFKRLPSYVYVHPQKLIIRGGWTIGDFILNNEEE